MKANAVIINEMWNKIVNLGNEKAGLSKHCNAHVKCFETNYVRFDECMHEMNMNEIDFNEI